MKNFLFFCFLLFLGSCFKNTDNRHTQTRSAEATEKIEPVLNVHDEILNCDDSEDCYLTKIENPSFSVINNRHRINYIIYAQTDALNSKNIEKAPTIHFEVVNFERSEIKEIKYTYNKNDLLGNNLYKSKHYTLYSEDDHYFIPVHASTLGAVLLNSFPSQSHYLEIEIIDWKNNIYKKIIEFFIYSNSNEAVSISRIDNIEQSPYYQFKNDPDNTYLIDSIKVENILSTDISTTVSIDVENMTNAFILEKESIQDVTTIPATNTYLITRYSWNRIFKNSYLLASAEPVFILKILEDGKNEKEINSKTVKYANSYKIISENIKLLTDQKIILNVYAKFSENKNILGNHGTINLYTGLSKCQTGLTTCNCYFLPPINIQFIEYQIMPILYFFAYKNAMAMAKQKNYPNCNVSNSYTQQLNIVGYPQKVLSLVGRHHKTNAEYLFESWYLGFEEDESISQIKYRTPVLESIFNFNDYNQLSQNPVYNSFIPY